VLADLPYGLTEEAWDRAPTQEGLDFLLSNVRLIASDPMGHYIFLWHNYMHTAMVSQALTTAGYRHLTTFVWTKQSKTFVGDPTWFIPTFELATLGVMGDRKTLPRNLSTNPALRCTHFHGPTTTKFYCDADGKIVNLCEKPQWLSKEIFTRLTSPGDRVLVLGAGSGAEVIAALDCGLHVVAVEKEERQYNSIIRRVIQYDSQYTEAKRLLRNKQPVLEDDASVSFAEKDGGDPQDCIRCHKDCHPSVRAVCDHCQKPFHSEPVSVYNTCRTLCGICGIEGTGSCSVTCHQKKKGHKGLVIALDNIGITEEIRTALEARDVSSLLTRSVSFPFEFEPFSFCSCRLLAQPSDAPSMHDVGDAQVEPSQ